MKLKKNVGCGIGCISIVSISNTKNDDHHSTFFFCYLLYILQCINFRIALSFFFPEFLIFVSRGVFYPLHLIRDIFLHRMHIREPIRKRRKIFIEYRTCKIHTHTHTQPIPFNLLYGKHRHADIDRENAKIAQVT